MVKFIYVEAERKVNLVLESKLLKSISLWKSS